MYIATRTIQYIARMILAGTIAFGAILASALPVFAQQGMENMNTGNVEVSTGGGFGLGIGIMILIGVVSILLFIFWIVMLIHAASKPIDNKVVWVIIIVLLGVLGAIIYFFAIKLPFDKQQKQAGEILNKNKEEERSATDASSFSEETSSGESNMNETEANKQDPDTTA